MSVVNVFHRAAPYIPTTALQGRFSCYWSQVGPGAWSACLACSEAHRGRALNLNPFDARVQDHNHIIKNLEIIKHKYGRKITGLVAG